MLKRIISLSLIIVMMVSLAGCKLPKATSVDTQTNTNNTESVTSKQAEKERVIEEAKAYLQANYPDDVFTYVSGRSPNWAYRYYELGFSSEKYDDQIIIVYGDPRQDYDPHSVVTSYYRDENGNVIYDYYDTYFEYTMKDEAEEYFNNVIKNYIDIDFDIRVAFQSSLGFAMAVDNSKNFVDNYTDGNLDFFVYVFTEDDIENADESMVSIVDKFKKNNMELWLDYVVVDSLAEIENIDIGDITNHYYDYFKKRISYSTTYKNNYKEI